MRLRSVALTFLRMMRSNTPVTLFCGAGISKARPASAPDWDTLKLDIVSALMKRVVTGGLIREEKGRLLLHLFRKAGAAQRVKIKPEMVLHWLHVELGDRLFESLASLNKGFPNLNHLTIAHLLKTYPSLSFATTNFDRYVERALDFFGAPYRVYASTRKHDDIDSFAAYKTDRPPISILKLHGTLANARTIKATLREVSRPIRPALRKAIAKLLYRRHILIVGYSGNDYDLFPTIASFSSLAKSVYWISRRYPTGLRRQIKNVTITRGNLNTLFALLGKRAFNCSLDVNGPRRPEERWTKDLEAPAAAYSLSVLGAFVGLSPMVSTMSKAVVQHRRSPRVLRAKAYNTLGISLKRIAPARCLVLYRAALKTITPVRQHYPELYGNLLGNLGSLYYELGRFDEAMRLLKNSNRWASKGRRMTLLALNSDDIGNILRAKGLAKESVSYHRKSASYGRRVGDLQMLARSLNNLGEAYAAMGWYGRAISCLRRSVYLKEKETADISALGRGCMSLGEVLIRNKQHAEGLQWLRKSLGLLRGRIDEVAKARAYYDVAFGLLKQGENDQGLRFLRKGRALARTIPHWAHNPRRNVWIGEIENSFDTASKSGQHRRRKL